MFRMRRIMSEFRSTLSFFSFGDECIHHILFQRTYSIKGPGNRRGGVRGETDFPRLFGTPGFMGVALTSRDGKTRPSGAKSLFCPFGGALCPGSSTLILCGVIQIWAELSIRSLLFRSNRKGSLDKGAGF